MLPIIKLARQCVLPPNTHFKHGEVSNPLGVSLGASYESGTQCHLDSQLLRLGLTPNEAKGGRPYQTMFGEFIKFKELKLCSNYLEVLR